MNEHQPDKSKYNKVEQQAIESLQSAMGYEFQKPHRLIRALTHSSVGLASAGKEPLSEDYERMEFLGDRVLNLVVADLLFKAFPKEKEGDLARRHTAFVRGEALAKAARKIGVQNFIRLSHGEKAAGGADNDNILADVMEALIAALYLDAGFVTAHGFVADMLGQDILDMDAPPIDPKTGLQEWTQARKLGLPQYTHEGRSGPDHAPEFTVTVRVPAGKGRPEMMAKGMGTSKRSAEKEAAKAMMALLDEME